MMTVSKIVGNVYHNSKWSEKLKKNKQSAIYETISLSRPELEKKRIRVKTNKGTELGLVLDSPRNLEDGDILFSNPEKFIVVNQLPEKVLVVNLKQKGTIQANEALIFLGHVIGNRHRPIQIEKERVIFPIISDSEFQVFSKLFSSISELIEMKIEERIFQPKNGMNVHEH